MTKNVSDGTVHKIPSDLKKEITSSKKVLDIWESLTPLARNEWICWATFVKKEDTRKQHIIRVRTELLEGMRRPCCWIGCIHRKDKKISSSVQYILDKKNH